MKYKYRPAIVIVAYNRAKTLMRLLERVENAIYYEKNVPLIISVDYSESNQDVIEVANSFQWSHGKKIVKKHCKNLGLQKHILECGNYSIEYGSIILLEDDIVVAPYFYEYACSAQNFYDGDKRVAGVSLYNHEWNGYTKKKYTPIHTNGDVYFGQFSCTWGQSWTKEQWTAFMDWYNLHPEVVNDGRMPKRVYGWKKSWGKFFFAYVVEQNKYYVMPYKALSTVFGEIGTHATKRILDIQVSLYMGSMPYRLVSFEDGSHYDAFFENLDLKKEIKKILNSDDICIDLYATPGRNITNRYVLTTRKIDCKIIAQYALDMVPHDANVFFDIKGDGIFLYDTQFQEKNHIYRKMSRIMYDCAGIKPRRALLYAFAKYWDDKMRK